MTLSARNRLEGQITELQLGGVMAHVVVRVGDNLIESVITRRSAEEMNLKVGDTVLAVIKSTEVLLENNKSDFPAQSTQSGSATGANGLTTHRACRVNSFALIARALQLHGQ
jgi:molybdopterin-binding protein